MKVVFIGGHITPALATIDALKKMRPDVELYFVGRMHTREGDKSVSPEYEIITSKNIPFFALTTGRLQRHFTRHTIPSLLKVPVGLGQAFNYLRDVKPDVVVSFGGYVAVPVIMAARMLGIKTITHEQTLVPGLANKIISRFVDVIALSFEDTKKYYPHARVVVTGNPIRQDVFQENGIFRLRSSSKLPVIYVTGGNQGAHVINEKIFALLPKLLEMAHVIHQTGNSKFFNDFEHAQKLQSQLISSPGEYHVFDYVKPDIIGDVMGMADIIVTRAGVNTLCELLALGKKAVMIPIPKTSHDEQMTNARFYVSTGLGVMLEEAHLTEDILFEQIRLLLESSQAQTVKDAARRHIRLDAADELARVILTMSS